MTRPPLPRYQDGCLADLLPSLGAQWGMPGTDRLGLPTSDRYVVLLIDGLGADALSRHAELAPFLSGIADHRVITCGAPTTTATSITSLGTGLLPGEHGIAGYTFWYRGIDAVLNALRWPSDVSGLDVQPQLTYFERLNRAGIHAAAVAPAAFADSGLTTVALRGASFWPVDDERDLDRRAELVAAAVLAGDRNLTYCYERSLDHVGHGQGMDSVPWRSTLANVDALAARLRAALPDDVRLVVTADHGMVDVPVDARVIVEEVPGLMDGVTAFAGEGRLRQLKVDPGRIEEVADRWRALLGERAWVRTRHEATEEGWFGPLTARLADRFGDVIVAMADDSAILSRTLPGELRLVGMHGSLTAAELEIPLLVA
jgi:hypothetical protein